MITMGQFLCGIGSHDWASAWPLMAFYDYNPRCSRCGTEHYDWWD